MTPADIISLIAWASNVSHFAIPLEQVEIHYVPHYVLEEFVCGKPCPVVGWTNPNTRPVHIYIDDDHREDPRILIHELIHVSQTLQGKYNLLDCDQARAAESDAYAKQNDYALQNGLQLTNPKPADCLVPFAIATRKESK